MTIESPIEAHNCHVDCGVVEADVVSFNSICSGQHIFKCKHVDRSITCASSWLVVMSPASAVKSDITATASAVA